MRKLPNGAIHAPPKPTVEITVTKQARLSAPDPRIPPHVWEILQECGEIAAIKLLELLKSPKFSKFGAASQANLIKLAFGYAYGKEAAASKETVSTSLSSEGGDAVAAILGRLADSAVLPEYSGPKLVSPEEGDH
jgi:hypothetical protein